MGFGGVSSFGWSVAGRDDFLPRYFWITRRGRFRLRVNGYQSALSITRTKTDRAAKAMRSMIGKNYKGGARQDDHHRAPAIARNKFSVCCDGTIWDYAPREAVPRRALRLLSTEGADGRCAEISRPHEAPPPAALFSTLGAQVVDELSKSFDPLFGGAYMLTREPDGICVVLLHG